jgi:hypothetical protein
MLKSKSSLAALPIGAAMLALSLGSANATCGVAGGGCGVDSLGPALILTLGSGGGIAVTSGPGAAQGAYDSTTGGGAGNTGDDSYLEVINNSGASISSFKLSNSGGIFGFDSDGIDTFGAPSNASDSSGYGGANVFFSNITATSGTVNFLTALANGGTAFFSLEGPPAGVAGSLAPLPSSWTMLLIGFAGLGFAACRTTKKSSQAVAAV